MGKMKGDTKLQTADTLRREIKKHRNLVVSYNSTMLMDDNVNME